MYKYYVATLIKPQTPSLSWTVKSDICRQETINVQQPSYTNISNVLTNHIYDSAIYTNGAIKCTYYPLLSNLKLSSVHIVSIKHLLHAYKVTYYTYNIYPAHSHTLFHCLWPCRHMLSIYCVSSFPVHNSHMFMFALFFV